MRLGATSSGGTRSNRGLVPLLGLLVASGCSTTRLGAATTQPNPLVAFPNQATHRSQKLYIDVRDMELPSTFKLRQSAYFNVVSRERLRFRVMLVHKWKEVADVTTWKVKLVDDKGRVFYPETQERAYDDFVTKMWDWEQRSAIRNQFGDIVEVNDDGYKRRVPLASVDVYQGAGDYVFHAKGLFHRNVKQLTLSMERSGVELRFTWNLVDLGGEGEVAAQPSQAFSTAQ
jgi:hypothetical protein